MSSLKISLIVFVCVYGGAIVGMILRAVLPQHHLNTDSKDAVKLAMGLVGTMAALVLGLLVASAKASYDAQGSELTQLAANVVMLDRTLAHYGPETQETRDVLRDAVNRFIDTVWSTHETGPSGRDQSRSEALYEKVQGLSPKDDRQRVLQAQALNMTIGLGQTRWLMFEQETASVSLPLVAVLVLWLTLILGSFGLFAPTNGTVVTCLGLCSLSISVAIFLVLEMYSPFSGTIHLSSAPLRAALARLGQ